MINKQMAYLIDGWIDKEKESERDGEDILLTCFSDPKKSWFYKNVEKKSIQQNVNGHNSD